MTGLERKQVCHQALLAAGLAATAEKLLQGPLPQPGAAVAAVGASRDLLLRLVESLQREEP